MKLWLDDIRPAPEGWIWCKDAIQAFALMLINAGQITHISLDHDLGEDVATGYDFLCSVERCVAERILMVPDLPEYWYVHSANPVGRKNMERAIESIKRLAL